MASHSQHNRRPHRRFRVYAETAHNGTKTRLVELGKCSDANTAFEFACMVRPHRNGEVRGIRIVDSNGRVWVHRASGDSAADHGESPEQGRHRGHGRHPNTRRARRGRSSRDGKTDWYSFGGGAIGDETST